MLRQCECGNKFTTTRKKVTQCRACTRGEVARSSVERRQQREAKAPGFHTRAEWRTIVRNQQEYCYWCGKSLRDSNGRLRPQKDHLTPLSRGGTDYSWNIVAVCKPCNVDKGDMTAGEYRVYLATNNKKSTVKAFTKQTATRRKSPLLESQMSLPLFSEWPPANKKLMEVIARVAASKTMEESILVFRGYDFGVKKLAVKERRDLLRDQAQKILQERRA